MLTKMETAANLSTAKEKKQILLQTENMSLFAGEQELLSDVRLLSLLEKL